MILRYTNFDIYLSISHLVQQIPVILRRDIKRYLSERFAADAARETLVAADDEPSRRRTGRRRGWRLNVVGQRSTTGEHAPVVRVILVNVPEESLLVLTQLLADLARQIVRTSQRP